MFEIGLWGAIVFAITMACAVSGIIYDDYQTELGLKEDEEEVHYAFDDQGIIYKL